MVWNANAAAAEFEHLLGPAVKPGADLWSRCRGSAVRLHGEVERVWGYYWFRRFIPRP